MKNINEAQIFLEQVEKVDAITPNKLIEMQQMYDLATSITAAMNSECVQSSGSKQKMADAVNKCLDIADDIPNQIDRLGVIRGDVIQTIEQLYSPTEYKLLHLRYVQHVPLKDIADMWGVEYTNITTTHGRALKNVQAILNKKEKVCDFR